MDRLNAALLNALAAPDVKETFAEQSVETIGSKPDEFDRVIRDDIAKWSRVVKLSVRIKGVSVRYPLCLHALASVLKARELFSSYHFGRTERPS